MVLVQVAWIGQRFRIALLMLPNWIYFKLIFILRTGSDLSS
jgi:hypothetical protein